ncbi:hypothetical protein FRC08_009147 [Ceratobasidium sp. 394]|nr:hypothetical protein FRC08_009147 [Ceratobasidium sp. 394]
MTEEEDLAGQDAGGLHGIRATAVQHFVEKAVAFCAATGFVDPDLSAGTKEGDYALAPLYERYLEYAEILAAQGVVTGETIRRAYVGRLQRYQRNEADCIP